MATNRYQEDGIQILLTVGAGVSSGDAGVVGQIPYVALIDADANDQAVVRTQGVFLLDVHGADDTGNVAVSEGDIVYWDSTELNVDATNGVRFGYALEAVGSGDTTTIKVKVGY
jgi:predicted RecA/RadA family phage recombinase